MTNILSASEPELQSNGAQAPQPSAAAAVDPLQTLKSVAIAPRMLEDDKPLSESLEWRLSEAYWNTAGTRGFVQSDIPYTITSSGTLSANAARLLFANCLEHPPAGAFDVLEIGAGTGLFARLFLDEFARLNEQNGRCFHKQITYYVTDRSPRTVAQWRELGLFSGCSAVLARADGIDPLRIEVDGLPGRVLAGVRAAFFNYALDSMPATVIRNGPNAPEELHIRTHLSADEARVKRHTSLSLQEIAALARNLDPALLNLLPVLDFEVRFRPCERKYTGLSDALTFGHDWPKIVLNYGAIDSVEKVLASLDPHGLVLINDYGLLRGEDAASMSAVQRFGPSSALGLNFPFLDHYFSKNGRVVVKPESDERLPLHPRLYMRSSSLPETERAFHRLFDWSGHRDQMESQEQARQHIEAGRMDDAKASYEAALAARSRDWVLLGEIAEFLIRQVASYQAAKDIAAAALAVNPWYSTWLWNVYGDALYALELYPDAHNAYVKASQLEETDPRTNLNLAYSFAQLADYSSALSCLARGLAHDNGAYRDRLLEKQQQILGTLQSRWIEHQQWIASRAARMQSA